MKEESPKEEKKTDQKAKSHVLNNFLCYVFLQIIRIRSYDKLNTATTSIKYFDVQNKVSTLSSLSYRMVLLHIVSIILLHLLISLYLKTEKIYYVFDTKDDESTVPTSVSRIAKYRERNNMIQYILSIDSFRQQVLELYSIVKLKFIIFV